MTLLAGEEARAGHAPEFLYAFPEAMGPHRFRCVAREGKTWRLYLVETAAGRTNFVEAYRTEEEAPAVRTARATDRARAAETFFKAPVWRADSRGGAEVMDLRFRSVVLAGRRAPFVIRFEKESGR